MPITTPEGAIISLLNADATVKSAVNGRIYPESDPTPYARPKLYYRRFATSSEFSNDGALPLKQARIYVYASADTLNTAKAIAIAVRNKLSGFAGTVDGFSVACIRVTDEEDEPTALDPGQTTPPQRVRLEITIDFYS